MMDNSNGGEKWYFTKEQLDNTPSRKCGYSSHKELFYRQKTVNFIQDMGKMLQVSTLCVCTAIVYMHRFYTFHSFTDIPWHQLAAAALFLAAKAQEQSRNLEYVIRVANMCRNPRDTVINLNSERYITQSHDLVFLENVLLQTLGFDLDIDIPHSYIISYFGSQRTSRQEISQTMANASLHLTTMCLQYKPTVVACVCINVACNRSNLEIEDEGWYLNVDPTVTAELLQQLTKELSVVYDACPSSVKKKFRASTGHVSRISSFYTNSSFGTDPEKTIEENGKDPHLHRPSYDTKSVPDANSHKQKSSRPHESCSSNHHQREEYYKERRDQKPLAAQQKVLAGVQSKVHHNHHHPSVDPTLKTHGTPHSRNSANGLANKMFGYPTQNQGKESAVRDSQECNNSNKETQKCELLKASVQTNVNSLNNNPNSQINYNAEKQPIGPNKSRESPPKIPSNEDDSVRRHNELYPYHKSETDNINKHLIASVPDKTSVKLPLSVETSKQNVDQISIPSNTQYTSGRSNASSYNSPVLIYDRIKSGSGLLKNEIPTLSVIKRPSLFSVENFPLHKSVLNYSPSFVKERYIIPNVSVALSPLSSPADVRNITYSSTEPELKSVMEKIYQAACFENLTHDNTICSNKIHHQILDAMIPLPNFKNGIIPYEVNNEVNEVPVACSENVETPDIISCDDAYVSTLINGEFNPSKIHNLPKETPLKPHLPVVDVENSSIQPTAPQQTEPEVIQKRHYHCKSKKNEKHRYRGKGKINKHNDKVQEAAQQKTLMSDQSKVPHDPLVDSKLEAHFKSKNYQLNSRTESRDMCRGILRNSPCGLANKVLRDPTKNNGKDSVGKDSRSNDSNKKVQKLDHLFKASVQTDIDSLSNYPSKMPPDKHESARTNKESKLHLKSKTTEIKKRVDHRASDDKASAYLNKSSQKVKFPLCVKKSKSILKQNVGQKNDPSNTQHSSGSSKGSSCNPPVLINDARIKLESSLLKDEKPTLPVIKKPSLFSPQKTPLHKGILKKSQSSVTKQNALLPLNSSANMGNMNHSSISSTKSVLIPVMEKIDKVKCFENLLRDNTINISKIHHHITLCNVKKEMILDEGKKELPNEVPDTSTIMNPPDNTPHLTTDNANLSTLVNSLEINPAIIRDLPKETPSLPHSPADAFVENSSQVTEVNHPKSKKRNRKKRNVKSKKDKKNKTPTKSIEINNCNYKNQPSPECSTQTGLNIQIVKNKKTKNIRELSQPPPIGDLKIKVCKEKTNSCSIISENTRKRRRRLASLSDVSQSKIPKLNLRSSK